MTDLSIIVVNWNTCGLLRRCLRDVYDNTQGLAFEVILVDNASTDGSVDMVRSEFPRVRLMENPENVGFAKANNQAIRASEGRYVLLLNSDAFLTQNAVHLLISVLEANPVIGIAGARLLFAEGRSQFSHGPLPSIFFEIITQFGLNRLLPTKNREASKPFVETGRVVGACMMARRSMLDQIGLLDESFFFYGEEVDLCQRAHQAGWRVVYVPGAQVIHLESGSSGITAKRILLLYNGKLRYFGKHKGRAARVFLLLAMWIATLVKLVGFLGLRVLTLGRVRRDHLWLGVAKGLAKFSFIPPARQKNY